MGAGLRRAVAATKQRWCVKANDGWHFSVPNKPHKQEASNIKTACGSFVILPIGCERRYTTCNACLEAVANRVR